MDLGLSGKKVIVTGGSQGIGLAIAQGFAAEGADLVIAGRDGAALEAAAGQLQGAAGVATLACDLSRDEARMQLFEAHGDADILVNNAGAIPAGDIATVSMEAWREGWELKVWGYIHLCKLFSAAMCARRSGTILNVIGMGGRAVSPGYIAGASGNAALIGFTQALGAGTPPHDVRVFGINPGPTLTGRITTMARVWAEERFGDADRWAEALDESGRPFGRIARPEEVGALAVMLCSPRVHYLSGTVVDMDGGARWT